MTAKTHPNTPSRSIADPISSLPADDQPCRLASSGKLLECSPQHGLDHEDNSSADEATAPDRQPHQAEQWRLCELKEHPLQSTFFPAESLEADLELAADMDVNGLELAIDILPDGTILCGHRRVKAAQSLGWDTIGVTVRHDLADDPVAAEAFFINDNYTRRHLTELQKARCAKRRVELAKQGKVALPTECNELKKTRDKIGFLMGGLSGRHVERYLKVLETPLEVQHACDAGHLSLLDTAKVAGYSQEKQELIAEELREQGLEHAKAIYDRHRDSKAATPRGANSIWCNLRRMLAEAVKELPGKVGNISFLDQKDLKLITEAEELFYEFKIHLEERLEDEEDDETFGSNIPDLVQQVILPGDRTGEELDTMSTTFSS